ncbi:hypothetical protein D7X33_20950 [Butyricicoccus sp. 1XD8-22]|nr:hypothetical protein D7X33_20950 [Butyricicoccus sp. 1XD8-22]
MAKRSVLRLDNKLQDTYSVRVPAGQEFENGFVAKLGDVEKANLDVHGVTAPASGDSIVIIGNPAIVYDNNRIGTGLENEYFMKADEVVRGYKPEVNKLVSISLEGFATEPAEGDIVTANGTYKLDVNATPAATGFQAKVVKIETVGGALAVNATQTATTYAVLEVLSV